MLKFTQTYTNLVRTVMRTVESNESFIRTIAEREISETNVRTAVCTVEMVEESFTTFQQRTCPEVGGRHANVATRGHKGTHKIFSTGNEVENKNYCFRNCAN